MFPGRKGFFDIEQTGKQSWESSPWKTTELKKLFMTTPKTESEFLKSMVPGFEQQYKQSAFYKAEQERLARTGEDEATQKRRQQLRNLNTGRTIFTRARR